MLEFWWNGEEKQPQTWETASQPAHQRSCRDIASKKKEKKHDVFICALFTCLFLLSFFSIIPCLVIHLKIPPGGKAQKVPIFGRWPRTFWYEDELRVGQLLAELPHSSGGVWVSFVQDFIWGLYEDIRWTVGSKWRWVDAMRPVMAWAFLPLNQQLLRWTPSPGLGRRGSSKKMDGYFTFSLQ